MSHIRSYYFDRLWFNLFRKTFVIYKIAYLLNKSIVWDLLISSSTSPCINSIGDLHNLHNNKLSNFGLIRLLKNLKVFSSTIAYIEVKGDKAITPLHSLRLFI